VSQAINRPSGMPDPVVAPINEGLWRAAADGRLDIQRCSNCGAHRYPPTDGCYRCRSLEWEWSTVPGTGTVYTYTWIPDATRTAELGRDVRYNVAVITLDGTEGDPVRVLSNVVDAAELGDLQVGQAVEAAFVPFGADLALPCFRRRP
jgi:uncharacterized OB-fold protein